MAGSVAAQQRAQYKKLEAAAAAAHGQLERAGEFLTLREKVKTLEAVDTEKPLSHVGKLNLTLSEGQKAAANLKLHEWERFYRQLLDARCAQDADCNL